MQRRSNDISWKKYPPYKGDRKSDQIDNRASGYADLVLTRELVNPVAKALWYIESHFGQEITLDHMANVAGVSRYHSSRVFGLATGHSIMHYMRGRRLTEAARTLAQGAPDILAVAIEAGYSSHEAFTRAFRDQFGLTPEAVRAQGTVNGIHLMEAMRMDEMLLTRLEPPRFENGKTLLIAGVGERYSTEKSANMPAQVAALCALPRTHSRTARADNVRGALQRRRCRKYRVYLRG